MVEDAVLLAAAAAASEDKLCSDGTGMCSKDRFLTIIHGSKVAWTDRWW